MLMSIFQSTLQASAGVIGADAMEASTVERNLAATSKALRLVFTVDNSVDHVSSSMPSDLSDGRSCFSLVEAISKFAVVLSMLVGFRMMSIVIKRCTQLSEV